MKKRKFKDGWSREAYKQFLIFYILCGKKDKAFFDADSHERKPEDFVRLLHITLALGFNKLFLQLITNVENYDEFYKCLDTLPRKGPTVFKWLDDFVKAAPESEFKAVVADTWEEIKQIINEDDFDVLSLLK